MALLLCASVGAQERGPNIDLWYGNAQPVGELGLPQPFFNILGNVSSADSPVQLTFSLNGGPSQSLSTGPDRRRLWGEGDFNIELEIDGLAPGANLVTIEATDASGRESSDTVILEYTPGERWRLPYTIDWRETARIDRVAQVVDGLWIIEEGALRTVQVGYDRVVAIGDLGWEEYEVVVPISVHGLDPRCVADITQCSGTPSVGIIMRWPGHSDWDGSRPRYGYFPIGAAGSYRWRRDDLQTGFLSLSNGVFDTVARDNRQELPFDSPHYFKMRVENENEGFRYSLKVWAENRPEPEEWSLVALEPLTGLRSGSVLLLTHHVDASFGTITISPLDVPFTVPPSILDVQAHPGRLEAELTWTTDRPTSGEVTYGTSSVHELGPVAGTDFLDSHSVLLSGLQPGTLYHFQLTLVDEEGIEAQSDALTFTTLENGKPVAHSTAISTASGTPVAIRLTARDPDGDPLLFEVVTLPQSGTLSGEPPALTYTPKAGFAGTDRLAFTAQDGFDTSAEASVTISVRSPPKSVPPEETQPPRAGGGCTLAAGGAKADAALLLILLLASARLLATRQRVGKRTRSQGT